MTDARLKKKSWQLWRNRRGQVSALRIVTLLVLVAPLLKAVVDAQDIAGGARPVNELIYRCGFWAMCFIALALAVTPFRRVSQYGALVDVRRMIGVAAFFYAAAHLAFYVVDQRYDLIKVVTEIVSRVYLTIGMIAWTGLLVLAVTSTDAMIKRIGGMRWRRLHQLIYLCAILVLIHYFQQTKADVAIPTFAAGILLWLLVYRLAAWRLGADAMNWTVLLALAVTVSVLVFAGEAIGIGLAFGVSPWRILSTAFDFDIDIRPGWQVLAAGILVAIFDAMSHRNRSRQSAQVSAQ